MADRSKGWLFILVGPSGVGKNTIMRDVIGKIAGLRQLPTATTRAARPGESEGQQHYFVTLDQFEQMKSNGDLLESQEVHPGKWYGVPRHQTQQALETGALLIADIDILGAKAVKTAFPANVVTIFIKPPTVEALRARLRERGEADLEDRFQRAEMELSLIGECDHVVVNDILERATQEVADIISRKING
ncbi:MAG: guanylate kinase [Anaerolineae bacterium]|nr:guanylate kinase [Anaerolineae bacterium]